ncbi:MAG TPA: hypothetical protein VK960_06630 [Acidimicrobiia bacterium]|nr:hypothetical protein [Acidimicrobiia bacterium]
MRRSVVLVGLVLTLLASACGDDDGGSVSSTSGTSGPGTTLLPGTTAAPGSTTAPPAGGDGGCAVTVTGGEERQWEGADDAYAFTTDYWYTEEELREQYDFFATEDSPPFEEVLASGESITALFLFNCTVSGGEVSDSISLFPSNATTRANLPFGPGTYEIGGGVLDAGEAPPGVFSAFYSPNSDDLWGQEGTGELVITRWDHERIQGTFSFTAEERLVDDPRQVLVEGTFDLTCQFSTSCG